MSISHKPTDLDASLPLPPWGEGPPPEDIHDGIYYPCSDGEEMGESDWHMVAMTSLFTMLRDHFEGRDVYVASDMMLYYERGNPQAVRAPDCMVILGVENKQRRSWIAWEENALLAVVFEIASEGTFREDLGAKLKVYEQLGIPEYIVFDPMGIFIKKRPFRGYRLHEGAYVESELDDEDGLLSEQLGLLIYPENGILRLVDVRTHRLVRTHDEMKRLNRGLRRQYRELKRYIASSRQTAEWDLLLERQKFEDERQKAEAEHQKAEAERRRADELAAENEKLRAMLGLKSDQ